MAERTNYNSKAWKEKEARAREERKSVIPGYKRIEGPKPAVTNIANSFTIFYSEAREEWACFSKLTQEVVFGDRDRATVVEKYQELVKEAIKAANLSE